MMVHTPRERGVDVVLVSEQYRDSGEDASWYGDAAGRAAVYIASN